MGGKSKDPGEEAAKVQREQLRRLAAIDLPELEQLFLETPELVGLLETEQLGPSALQDIALDPRMREAQMRALAELEERGVVGLTPEDRARLSEIRRETAGQEQAAQKAILQSMAERGQLDSGAQLIAQMQASGAGATEAQRAGEQLAAQAAAARRQALQQAGGMAGQMEQAQYGRDAQAAQARDAIQQFNLAQRANTAAQNLAARQNIEQQRVQARQQEQKYNAQIPQQQFQNELARAGAQGQATSNLAQIAASQQPQQSPFQSALGGAATGAGIGANFGPAGAGYGAAIGAGLGILGGLEDGGLANEADRVAKKKYKNAEYYRQDYRPALQNGGVPGMFDFDGASLQEGLDAGNAVIYGQDTDKLAGEDMTYSQAKETMDQANGGFNMDNEDVVAALSGLNQLLGPKKQAKRPQLNLQGGNYKMPENILGQALRMEDGGGTYQAQDGRILFESTGNGDIVGGDSFERDRIDARLNSGEAVLNVAQQQRLMDLLRGEADVQDLGEEDIVEGVPSDYQAELKREIDKPKSEQQKKIEGLENLLKALGK